jgi:predicted phosphoribosyltransferase
MAGLAHLYDEIIAVDRPLGRRALAWHYDDFDTIDDATATRLLEAQ